MFSLTPPPSPTLDNEEETQFRVGQRRERQESNPDEEGSFLKRRAIRVRRPFGNMPPEWMRKSPALGLNENLEQCFSLNGVQFQVVQLENGKGSFHKVFRFIKVDNLTFGNTTVSTQNVVLKILNSGEVGPNKERKVIEEESQAYQHLKAVKVPVPKIYADPITFVDTENPKNGKFWIVKKMPASIDSKQWEGTQPLQEIPEKERKILEWAKGWLTKMAKTNKDLINDFRIRNTMLNEKDQPVVVDFSKPEEGEWEKKWGLYRYVVDWAKGNHNVFDYLISDFPEKTKSQIAEWNANA